MARTRDRAAVYKVAERFVDFALRRDDSLFTPGSPVWALAGLDDLHLRFVEQLDDSSDRFEDKLRRQLEGAPPATLQLMAEILFVHFLLPVDFRGETKRRMVVAVLGWSSAPVRVPEELAAVLDQGLVRVGTAFNTYRPFQLHFLIHFLRLWKRLSHEEREAALADPWKFKELAWRAPFQKAQSQREGLLHLVFPDVFENIVSRSAKERITQHFASLVKEPTDDMDRKLLQIRRELGSVHGAEFSFYDQDLVGSWQQDSSGWGQFLHWVRRFYEQEDFDVEERDYKLQIAEKLRVARDELLEERDWLPSLRQAFGSPNNLTAWWTHDRFLKWCDAEPALGAEALRALWGASGSAMERIGAFLSLLPDAVSGTGSRLNLASFLLMAIDPLSFPVYKQTPFRSAYILTGTLPPRRGAKEIDIYEHALRFLDRLIDEASARGIDLRDRLDAQGVLWSVVTPSSVVDTFSAEERMALRRYLGEVPPDPEERNAIEHLAGDLLLDPAYVRRVAWLLEDKGQIIFYGPPGTGKTWVAGRSPASSLRTTPSKSCNSIRLIPTKTSSRVTGRRVMATPGSFSATAPSNAWRRERRSGPACRMS